MRITTRVIPLFAAMLLIIFYCLLIPANALSWDGSSAGGGGKGSPGGTKGYAIRYTDNSKNLLGYRFSVVDKSGSTKNIKCIDVFRKAYYGYAEYENAYKFDLKYNKKQLIDYQNGNYSTSKTTVNCYKEEDMGFASELPVPAGLETWQNNTTNLNKILSALGIGSISTLNNGDKILVEPIYDVRLESVYHALTVTEIAIYGKHILGASSDGGSSSTPESWGFISNYTNKHYPNSLFTPDGQSLWDGVSSTSSRLSFYNVINKGYGVGIAYTETKNDFSPALHIKLCRAYKGTTPTKTYAYGDSIGNHFAYWFADQGYPAYGDNIFFSVYFPKEEENTRVQQTVWIDGVQTGQRTGYSDNLAWYDVTASVKTVPVSKTYYTVKARVDWLNGIGSVKQYGVEKTFYIPVKPVITREKVTAYAIDGSVQAYSGSAESSGKMYFGQRVTFQYKYGSTTSWASSNNISAVANRWNGSSWAHIYTAITSGEDVSQSNISLSSSSPYNKNSSIGTYTIFLPATTGTNSYKLKFDMTTAWASDTSRTKQTTTYYLPIVKADVEFSDMKLVDSSGNYVDRQKLTRGDELTIHYFYKNNTDCTVYINGYKDDKTQIFGVYAIPAGETITVDGGKITVPDQDSFSIWGGVYLDGVERGNTDYESDGDNNSALYLCKTVPNEPELEIVPIVPNASYRENTDVIISYYLKNSSSVEITPSSPATVRLRIYNNAGTLLNTFTKTVIVPANDQNLVYFKWSVPTGLNGKSVTVKADIKKKDGSYYGEVSRSRSTTPYTVYSTPDTRYEEKEPTGFAIPSTPSENTASATWYEYVYENGRFVKKNYGLSIARSDMNTITPATGETAEQKNGKWYMKSGYGISLESRIYTTALSGYTAPNTAAYTPPQYGYVLYPEYGHIFADGKATTLYNNGIYFVLQSDSNYERVHYTPLWYPDGNYTVKVVQTDCWTPAGMLTKHIVPNTIIIDGNAYDDWYIGRK